jgi:hypothetical protein
VSKSSSENDTLCDGQTCLHDSFSLFCHLLRYTLPSPFTHSVQRKQQAASPADRNCAQTMATTPPQEFLTPAITDELEKHLGGLEDFFLDEDDEKKSDKDASRLEQSHPAPTSTSASSTTSYSRPLIESSAESVWAAAKAKNAAQNTSQSIPQPKASPTQTYPSWNAVHMEVQSNAKLPTFNISVNRSNSLGGLQIPAPRGRRSYGPRRPVKADSTASSSASSVSGMEATEPNAAAAHSAPSELAPSSPIPRLRHNTMDPSLKLDNETSEAIDEILRLNENDMNLSEMFLDEDRSSAALAYSCYGGSIPKSFDIPKIDSKSSLDGSDVGANAAGIAPRPLASQTKMFYTRQKPLPIPGSTPKKAEKEASKSSNETSTTSNTLAQAIATAAAIATNSDQGGTMAKSTAAALSIQPTQPPGSQDRATPIIPPRRTASDTHPVATIPPRPNPPQAGNAPVSAPYTLKYQPVARPPSISHAAAHATTKASLAYAQAQRSSYGYGANHRVVGVPAPPPNARGFPQQPVPSVRHHPSTGAPCVPMYTARLPPKAKTTTASPLTAKSKAADKDKKTTSVDSEDPAYERKKQRAKDARVRLNESIEELGIAIELAGSQSRERLQHLASMVPIDPTKVPTLTPLQKFMAETVTQAENAKKWDRPSFVGLAATLIHSLNAQCEGLIRDVIQLKRENEQWRRSAPHAPSADAGNVSPDASNHYCGSYRDNNADASEPVSKKQKIEETALRIAGQTITFPDTQAEENRHQIIKEVAESSKILGHVTQFLDPPTLCRCLCVSKEWISMNVFQDQQTWLSLCYKRFGTWSVRKWEGDEDDEEEATASHASPSMDLYCRMVEGNVKPYSSLDGSVFLGGSSLDGLVSGWVSLVERSNGETSRSVLLTKTVDGKPQTYYSPIPVVELRIFIQNTGYSNGPIHIPDQQFSVDASTRRKGEKLLEITTDDRFKRRVLHLDKANNQHEVASATNFSMEHEMCQLNVFEYAVLSVSIHARGCSTTSKFCHRAKKIQVLVSINGTTRPLVVPISGQR